MSNSIHSLWSGYTPSSRMFDVDPNDLRKTLEYSFWYFSVFSLLLCPCLFLTLLIYWSQIYRYVSLKHLSMNTCIQINQFSCFWKIRFSFAFTSALNFCIFFRLNFPLSRALYLRFYINDVIWFFKITFYKECYGPSWNPLPGSLSSALETLVTLPHHLSPCDIQALGDQ
jgi:hypothetical protein